MNQSRYFTLEGVNQLLPWLEKRLRRIASLRADLERLHQGLQAIVLESLSGGNGDVGQKVAAKRKEIDAMAEQLAPLIPVLRTDMGIVVRDPDRGVLDFLALREGREVYLCWMLGEDQILFWHEIDAGFSERQPL